MRKITLLFCALLLVPTLALANSDMVSVSELRQQVETMGRWTASYEAYKRKIEVDIPIDMPEVDAVPIVQVSGYYAVDQEGRLTRDGTKLNKIGYDGFDIDYEPNFGHRGNMSGSDENMLLFIQTLGERIGPKSGTDRLLVIDGEPQSIVSESGPYFNYFIVQAYDSPGDNTGRDNLDSRLNSTIRNFDGHLTAEEVAKKYIVTENFEKWALSGGADFTDRYGNKMKSLEGMARWTPIIDGKKCVKGGVGTYHMEYEYTIDGTEESYPYLRNAIRIMNPPVK